jgi:acetylornithine/N-succinyldiaminopimelate aminotransferase
VMARAALAALDVIDHPGRLARVMELGERLAEGLRVLPGVREVRGRGLMLAAEVDDAPDLVRRALLEQRLVVNATGPTTVRFLPPLIVSHAEIDEALARMDAVL